MISSIVVSAFLLSAAAAPVPVILDTDLGDDIDDTWALAMLLGSPHVDVKLIVTASDNTETKTRLVAKILERMGRTDIPLAQGVKNSDNTINQAAWLGDYQLSQYKGKVVEDGVGALVDTIKKSEERITLCVIGPQTNIAEALRRAPDIADKARIVSMAGSVYIGYKGKEGADPEWNVFKDVAAARAVFAAKWEVVYAPLDICGTLTLSGDRYKRVAASDAPLAKVTIANYDAWANRKHYAADASSVLFDTAAVYLCMDESNAEMKTIKLSIDDKGATVVDEAKGRPVRCGLAWKDRDKFEEGLIKAITGAANPGK